MPLSATCRACCRPGWRRTRHEVRRETRRGAFRKGGAVNIPLFPLDAVLFPKGAIMLQIFEQRYISMISQCLRQDAGFGICLGKGSEGKDADGMHGVGTYARIFDWEQLENGLLGIRCRGERRFTIMSRTRRQDGLNEAEVRWRPEKPCAKSPPILRACLEYLQRRSDRENLPFSLDDEKATADPHWVSYRLAELLPLTVKSRQTVLEMDDAPLRLKTLFAVVQTLDSGDQPS